MWKDTLMPSWRSRCLIGVWMEILPPYSRREISEHYRDDFRKWLVKKKFTCTIQRKTTLAWLKKVLNQMKNKEVLLSNIIHLLKRKRQSDNIHVQQWTIDNMTVFWARGSSPSDTDESSLSLTVACHRSVFFLRSFVWVFLSSYRY